MKLSIENLLALFKKKGIEAELQQETGQIVFAFQVDDEPFPLFIRIFEESQLLQILVFLPVKLAQGQEGEVGRLLHWINQSLDLPGFGMEENSRSIFYRVMLPALGMSMDDNLLDPFLGAIRVVATTFLASIRKVNNGATFEEVRKEVS